MKKDPKEVYDEISRLLTEERNPDSMHIDEMSLKEVVQLINWEDQNLLKNLIIILEKYIQ